MNTLSNLPAKLRDPVWQALGTIIAVIALIVSTIVAYDIYFKSESSKATELVIDKRYSYSPLNISDDRMSDRIKFQLDGQDINSLFAFSYSIQNSGQNPILPSDFIEPIQVSFSNDWEILFVETTNIEPAGIDVNWTRKSTNSFELTPLLLNAGDKIEVVIYVTHPRITKDPPDPEWSGRIVNIKNFLDSPSKPEQRELFIFRLAPYITFTDGGTYIYLALSALLTGVMTWIMGKNKKLPALFNSTISRVPLIAVFSFLGANGILRLIFYINTDVMHKYLGINMWTTDPIEIPRNAFLVALYLLTLVYVAPYNSKE